MYVLTGFGVGRAALVLLCSLFPVSALLFTLSPSLLTSVVLIYSKMVYRSWVQLSSHVIPVNVVFEII